MPDKRFLGLGFSFAATDKGMKKYLQTVKGLVSDISDGMEGLGKSSKTFKGFSGSAFRASKSASARPQTQPRQRAHTPSGFRKSPFHSERHEAIDYDTFDILEDKISSVSKLWAKSIGKTKSAFGSLDYEKFNEKLHEMSVGLKQFNHLTAQSQKRIVQMAQEVAQEAKVFGDLRNGLGKFSEYMGKITEHAKTIFGDAESFLITIGADFRKMIPPQFSAAAKLMGSILMTPVKIGKFLGKKALESADKAHRLALIKSLKNIEKKIGRGGTGKRGTVIGQLDDINESVKPKQEKSFLSKIKDMFSKLGGFLWKALGLGAAGKLLSKLGGSSVASKAGGFFKSLLPETEFLGNIISKVGGFFEDLLGPVGEVIAAVAVFGASIWGAITGIVNTSAEWKNFFSGIVDLGVSAFKLVGRFIESTGVLDYISPILNLFYEELKGLVSGVKEVASFLVQLPITLLKMVKDGWENIFGWIGIGAGKLGDSMKSAAASMDSVKFGKNSAPPTTGPATTGNVLDIKTRQPITPILPTAPSSTGSSMDPIDDRSRKLRENVSMKNQDEQLKNMEQQLAVMKDQNDKLDKLVDALTQNKSSSPGYTVTVSHDARKAGIFAEQQAGEQYGLTGGY